MARFRFWKCPDCGGTFRHLHHPDDEPAPDRCALCGSWMSDAEPSFVPQAPAVGNSARVKAVDDVYYGMEDASRVRAEQMAEMTPGASASDFNHTLVTNLRDRQRPGDIAAMPAPPSPVTQQMDFLQARGGNVGFGGGSANRAEFAHIPQGGHAVREQTGRDHWSRVQAVTSRPIATYTPEKP